MAEFVSVGALGFLFVLTFDLCKVKFLEKYIKIRFFFSTHGGVLVALLGLSVWRSCLTMLFSKDHTAGFQGRSCSDLIKHEEGGGMFGITRRSVCLICLRSETQILKRSCRNLLGSNLKTSWNNKPCELQV